MCQRATLKQQKKESEIVMITPGDLVIVEGKLALVLQVGKQIFDINPDYLCVVTDSQTGQNRKEFMSRMRKANV